MYLKYKNLNDGKAYPYATFVVRQASKAFFRNLCITNMQDVPTDKPVLLAANHPTAFLDPTLLCLYMPVPVYNMTRGDIFKKPLFRKMMESINMFPVFRVQDGYVERDRNDVVFEYIRQKLVEKKLVAIYVEGQHHLEKRVRPAQKGLARIAFQTYEMNRLDDLQVLPVGFSYQYGDRMRDTVMLNIGKPFAVRDYWEMYLNNPAEAVRKLSRDIELALQPLCLHIEDTADDPLTEYCLDLHRSEHPSLLLPAINRKIDRFNGEKAVCNRINAMPTGQKAVIMEKAEAYFSALKQAGLKDEALMNPHWGAWYKLLVIALLFPVIAFGRIVSWPCFAAAQWVTRTKVKKLEFKSSVLFGAFSVFAFVYFGLLFLASLFTLNPICIGVALLMPLLYWAGFVYADWWSMWRSARTALDHKDRQAFLNLRNDILKG